MDTANLFFHLTLFLLFMCSYSVPVSHKKVAYSLEELSTDSATASLNQTTPTVYFEVTKPIHLPNAQPCVYSVIEHDFGVTYGKPPVTAAYSFSKSGCESHDFSKIVLEWNSTAKGRQFDRIFGVWLGGVELLRSCTAEPRRSGIFWQVQKDITKYRSLLLNNSSQDLSIYLGNLIDSTYTAVYHVNVSIYFYPVSSAEIASEADLILPISRAPSTGGLWLEIRNSTDLAVKEFLLPQNAYRAVLEVYVSFHENDEFWYSNYPNDYIRANNLTDTPGNGPFREILITLDGVTMGAIWPFTVIYTGGVNPLLWRPITGIGSFDLPSYDIEITPFLGNVLDGKLHKFGFSVTNALNVWYIDANLHLWLDPLRETINGGVLKHECNVEVSAASKFKEMNGNFQTSASRHVSLSGWVNSSLGVITSHFKQRFEFRNEMEMGKDGDLQIVNQTIHFNNTVISLNSSHLLTLSESSKTFQTGLFTDTLDEGNGTTLYVTNVTLGLMESNEMKEGQKASVSSLKNEQRASGSMKVGKKLVVGGVGSTEQVYKYDRNDFCYFRNVSSFNYTVLHDVVRNHCISKRKSIKKSQLLRRRESLANLFNVKKGV